MILTEGGMSSRLLRWELPFVGVFAWIAFISIPLFLGEIGISWDALNHHIYLGWTAGRPRFDLDFTQRFGNLHVKLVEYPYYEKARATPP